MLGCCKDIHSFVRHDACAEHQRNVVGERLEGARRFTHI